MEGTAATPPPLPAPVFLSKEEYISLFLFSCSFAVDEKREHQDNERGRESKRKKEEKKVLFLGSRWALCTEQTRRTVPHAPDAASICGSYCQARPPMSITSPRLWHLKVLHIIPSSSSPPPPLSPSSPCARDRNSKTPALFSCLFLLLPRVLALRRPVTPNFCHVKQSPAHAANLTAPPPPPPRRTVQHTHGACARVPSPHFPTFRLELRQAIIGRNGRCPCVRWSTCSTVCSECTV